ncbi:MAG TPA: hypothetical protein VFB19_08830 [Mycobacterium sp.]|nr:hypothetical protein [Mycobacterium sp.]
MSSNQFPARRTACALAIAAAALVGPLVATPGASAQGPGNGGAGPSCTINSTPGDTSLACQPGAVSQQQGAPSEMGLTDSNNSVINGPGPHG